MDVARIKPAPAAKKKCSLSVKIGDDALNFSSPSKPPRSSSRSLTSSPPPEVRWQGGTNVFVSSVKYFNLNNFSLVKKPPSPRS